MKKVERFIIIWAFVCIGLKIISYLAYYIFYAVIMFIEIFIQETIFSGVCTPVQFNSRWFFECSPGLYDNINLPVLFGILTLIITLCITNYSRLKKALRSVAR